MNDEDSKTNRSYNKNTLTHQCNPHAQRGPQLLFYKKHKMGFRADVLFLLLFQELKVSSVSYFCLFRYEKFLTNISIIYETFLGRFSSRAPIVREFASF